MNYPQKIQILTVILLVAAMPTWAQTNSSTPPPDNGQLRQKLQQMTPEQRQQFMQNHPEIRERMRQQMMQRYQNMTPEQRQQFAQNHPQAAQRLANASQAGPGKNDPGHPRVNEVNQREQNQQNRISQGQNSGSLTAGETARIDKGENRLQARESKDMANNNGHLTPGEDKRLNRDENHLSREVYRDKHNARTTTAN